MLKWLNGFILTTLHSGIYLIPSQFPSSIILDMQQNGVTEGNHTMLRFKFEGWWKFGKSVGSSVY